MRLQAAGAQLNLAIKKQRAGKQLAQLNPKGDKIDNLWSGGLCVGLFLASFLVVTVRLLANKYFLKHKSV